PRATSGMQKPNRQRHGRANPDERSLLPRGPRRYSRFETNLWYIFPRRSLILVARVVFLLSFLRLQSHLPVRVSQLLFHLFVFLVFGDLTGGIVAAPQFPVKRSEPEMRRIVRGIELYRLFH